MKFERFASRTELVSVVDYFWTLSSDSTDTPGSIYRLIPDGYVDWVFHIGDSWSYRFQGTVEWTSSSSSHLFGQLKTYVDVRLPDSSLDFIAVKFKPWVCRQVLGTELHLFTDSFAVLDEIPSLNGTALTEDIHTATSSRQRINTLETFLLKRLQKSASLSGGRGLGCITSGEFDRISTRRLQQLYRSEVGISPKLMTQIQRTNRSMRLMNSGKFKDLTSLAHFQNYYDQSHFIREFKKFTGMSPSHFLDSIAPSGEIFNLKVA